MLQASKIFNTLLSHLAPRQREVLIGRFGLNGGEPQTLAALGERYGITRERVRQIEASALDIVRHKIKATPAVLDIVNVSQKYLRGVGGVAKEGHLLAHHESFVEGLTPNHVALLLEATGTFQKYPEDDNFQHFYYSDKDNLKKAMEFNAQLAKFLRARKSQVLSEGYEPHLKAFVKDKKIDAKLAENYVGISKLVSQNSYGDMGLAEWPEISPKTIRDRIYLILKKKNEPLHFETIAKQINDAKFGGRKALAPTVHNELIKDERFVLVGRGMYGLKEHGFEPGTAKEVIHRILKKKGSMNFQEIVTAVQKERFFKPNTILANLQNKDLFERLSIGTYRVNES